MKDQRLKNIHELVQDLDNERYRLLFSSHPFQLQNLLIEWLANHLYTKVQGSDNFAQIPFSSLTGQNDFFDALKRGDLFYCTWFSFEKMIPDESKEFAKSNPLTRVINKIYNSIWEISSESESNSLAIYWELEKYFENLLGVHVAKDSKYSRFDEWLKISHASSGMWTFYESWTLQIGISEIERNIDQLVFITPSKLHELVDMLEFRRIKERADVSLNYEKKIQSLSAKSDWEFIREATDKSDMISLNDDLILRKDLLLRVDIKSWLLWLDNLNWPIVQDHAFGSVQELHKMEQLIELIVKQEIQLKTKSQHLLLIALKNYFELVEKITDNLYHIKQGQWDHYNKEQRQNIINEALTSYDKWTNSDLTASCLKVFELIFANQTLSQSEYFIGIFEWITSYSKEQYLSIRHSEPGLKTLKEINESFENILIKDSKSISRILNEVKIEKINWQILEKLFTLIQSNQTDVRSLDAIYNKYIDYLNSEHFTWNLQDGYNDVVINQAYNLSCVIAKLLNPLSIWLNLQNQFKRQHEGWIVDYKDGHNSGKKEIYVLMVGTGLAYSYYDQGKIVEGEEIFSEVLKITLSQYRISSSLTSKDYWIVLRFLAHTISHFSPKDIDSFIEVMEKNCDDLELFLILTSEIVLHIERSSLELSQASISIIENQISENFWKIEMKYGEFVVKHMLEYFSALKHQVFASLNELKNNGLK